MQWTPEAEDKTPPSTILSKPPFSTDLTDETCYESCGLKKKELESNSNAHTRTTMQSTEKLITGVDTESSMS